MFAALFGTTPPAFRDDVRLDGERLYLRPRTLDDDAALFAYASDPEVIRFLPWEPAPSVTAVQPFLAETVGRRRKAEAMDFAIVLRDTDEVVGQTDLMELKSVRGQAELGYIIARPFWGRGLMTEAAAMTVEYGFGPLRLGRIVAYADRENLASQRVMQKLGMRHTASEVRAVKGEQRPYVRYEITRAEWDARKTT
jgi:ribosomal-protein-alanine N-acetyltransferase